MGKTDKNTKLNGRLNSKIEVICDWFQYISWKIFIQNKSNINNLFLKTQMYKTKIKVGKRCKHYAKELM